MLTIEPLKKLGIHNVFDGYMKASYVVRENRVLIGYVCFHETERKVIWVHYILAERRGSGAGVKMLQALFNQGYQEIQGTAVYGPHLFWKSVGSVFLDEVKEGYYNGTQFVLNKSSFIGN